MTWDLKLGDCLDPQSGLPSLQSLSVDACICDPPYEQEVHSQGRRIRSGGFAAEGSGEREIVTKAISYAPITEAERREVARQIARVTRRWILVFCQVEAAMLWRDALVAGGAEYVRTGSWHKTDGQPQMSGDRPGQGWEAVVICHGKRARKGKATDPRQWVGRMRWNGGGHCAKWRGGFLRDVWNMLEAGRHADAQAVLEMMLEQERAVSAAEGLHLHAAFLGSSRGTGGNLKARKLVDGQKPEWLMEDLILKFTDPGELVLDPFTGSGTTGVVAVRKGRRFLGWERLEAHREIARLRLAALGDDLAST